MGSEIMEKIDDSVSRPVPSRLSRMFTCVCPYCKEETGIGTVALFDTVLMSRKTCEKCGHEFLIVHDVPMIEEKWIK
jgi:uncharacterized protein (DUF983 family)